MRVTLNGEDLAQVIDALRYKTQSLIARVRYVELHHPQSKKKLEEMLVNLERTQLMYNQLKSQFNIVIDDKPELGSD